MPAISSNGDSEPSSTSLIRVIFSSMTLLRSGDAVEMTIMNISIISTIGVTKLRIGSDTLAGATRPSPPRVSSPRRSSCISRTSASIVCGSTLVLRRRSAMTRRPTTSSSQRGSGWKVGLSV